ncbi:MAG: hypothetical protein ACFE8L_13660 [Candidatus Hodarchaeota archaeon]
MKKKSILITGIIFISFLVAIRSVRGAHYCDIQEFYTDKAIYYNDEQIQINATWDLQYDIGDICYNQIHIYNETDDLVWISDYISDLGQHNYIWTVWIQDLNTSFKNDYSIFYIRIYHYWESPPGSPSQSFLDEIQVGTIKRNVTCELKGFKNVIRYGEVLNIKATFYNTTGQNRIELKNYQIHFKVSSKGTVTFNRTYVTNSSGMIETISLNKSVLSIGVNILSFTMNNDTFFNDLDYDLSLVVTETKVSQALSDTSDRDVNDGENGEYLIASIISVICFSFAFLGLMLYKNYRRNQKQNLADISFKY